MSIFDTLDPGVPGGSSGAPPPPTSGLRPNIFDSIDPGSPSGGTAPQAPGKTSGLIGNVGAGINESIADVAGMPVDLVNRGLGLIGLRSDQPIGGSQSIKQVMGLIGANPENVSADTEPERIARTIGSGIGSVAVPGLGAEAATANLAKSLSPTAMSVLEAIAGGKQAPSAAGTLTGMAKNAGIGAASGAGQDLGERLAPDGYKPAGALLGSLAGGGLGALGISGGEAFWHAYRQAPEAEAATKFLGAASNPDVVQTRLNGLAPDSRVPGVQPTTGELTNDQGLLQTQNWARNQRPEPFTDQAFANNAVRVQQLGSLAPTGAPEDASQFFRAQLDRIDQAHQDTLQAAQAHADQTLGDMGGNPNLGADVDTVRQQYGQQLRQFVQEAEAARKQAVDRLWDAARQNGDLAFDSEPAQLAAQRGLQSVNAQAGDRMVPREQELLNNFAQWNGPVDFETLSAARTNVSSLINQLAREGGANRSVSRLMELRNGLDTSIDTAISSRVSAERTAVGAGTLDPEQTATVALERFRDRFNPSERPSPAVAMGREGLAPDATGNSSAVPGYGGTVVPAGGQRALAIGNQGLAKPPQSLLAFLIAKGGIQEQGGELRAMDARLARPGLQNRCGMPLDYAREAAEQAGYLPPGSSVNDLLNAVSDELQGRNVYRPDQQAGLLSDRNVARERDAYKRARSLVMTTEDNAGLRLTPKEIDHASQLVVQGFHPEEAIRQAAAAGDDAAFQRHVESQAFGLPGVPAGAQQGTFAPARPSKAEPKAGDLLNPQRAGDALQPQADGTTADRYAAARQGYREYKQTFDEGPAGRLLERGNYGREWDLPDSQAAGVFWNSGKHQAEDARAFETAAGGRPEAVAALKDYAASELRRFAAPNGTVVPARWQTWMRQHDDALSVYPELRETFGKPAAAQEAVDRVIAEGAETRKRFETSAARFWLKNDPDQAIAKAMGDKGKAPDNLRQMMQAAAANPAAQAGIRRATLDWIMRKGAPQGIAGKEAGDTGTSLIRGQTLRNLVNDYHKALGQVFSREQMAVLDRIADDLVVADRSLSGSKPPIGPGTARDIAATGRFGAKPMTLLRILAAGTTRAAFFAAGEHFAGLPGALAGMISSDTARELSHGLSAARNERIQDLLINAILDPQQARILLTKATPENAATLAQRLSKRMMQTAIAAAPAATTSRPGP